MKIPMLFALLGLQMAVHSATIDELVEQGKYSAAQGEAAKEVASAEAKSGANDVSVAQALLKKARLLSYSGKSAEQIPLCTRALKIFQTAKANDGVTECLRNLAFAHMELEQFDEAEKYHKEELELLKKNGAQQFEIQEVEKYLVRVVEMKQDAAAAKSAPPIEINGKKVTMHVQGILMVSANPQQDSKQLLQKGGRQLQAMGESAVMLVSQGRQYMCCGTDVLKQMMPGSPFVAGDLAYRFESSSKQAKEAFLKDYGLSKSVSIKTPDGEEVYYIAGKGVYVSVITLKEGYICGDPKCEGFMKKFDAEGQCASCKKRLIHSKSWE